jgi:DNA-binding SARP family transcriptional activator
MSQLAAESGRPVTTYLAESGDCEERAFLARLRRTLEYVVPLDGREWRSSADAAHALERALERRTLLLLDDFHILHGTPAEHACERLIEHSPKLLTLLLASRSRPCFNLSRLRVSSALVEIGPDDLRFRSWEVERLFRDVYREPLPPEALAELTRRTEGWAAGLQLFNLATRQKPAAERRRTLAGLGNRSGLVRDYLARNVLNDLSDELRSFLLETSVLGRLSGALCDSFLETTGSERLLRELEVRQIFTQALVDGGYRYHEILRAHLEAAFVESSSEVEARARYRRAAVLLEADGGLEDALRAYCRGESWSDVARLLGQDGERMLGGASGWLALLPRPIIREDPWLLLAAARQERSSGRFAAAIALYHEAERLFPAGAASSICLRERLALAVWVTPEVRESRDAWGMLREATVREPLTVRRRAAATDEPAARLVGGLAALLAGHVRDAAGMLAAVADDAETSGSLAAAARLGRAVALLLSGDSEGVNEAEQAAEEAEQIGSRSLERLSRAALALAGGSTRILEATACRVTSEIEDDRWGCLLAALFEGWGTLLDGESADSSLEQAVQHARELGAGVLEVWARAAHSLSSAREGNAEAGHVALQTEISARITGVKGAQGLVYLALAETQPDAATEYQALARNIEEECGLALPSARSRRPGQDEPPSLDVRCFGGFRLLRDGETVDISGAKPGARRVLRHLAVFAGRPVHRESLIEALWPGAAADGATRHLHVLISTLRHALEPGVGRGESSLIVRDGESYRFELPPGARSDVVDFDRAIADGRGARLRGDRNGAAAAFQQALDLHVGDLLPEDGPAEWVLDERELRRAEACESAHALGECLLADGEPLSAAIACERGLHLDRYEDGLWRLCAAAYEQAGDAAAAERTRQRYAQVLTELGLVATPR